MKLFLIGHPVEHSLSPKLHNHWLRVHGIDATYEAIDTTDLGKTMAEQKGAIGGNITAPYKEDMFLICKAFSTTAMDVGAINTVLMRDGDIHGYNTDIDGFLAPLEAFLASPKPDKIALILGGGGAAKAAVRALSSCGVSTYVTTRSGDNLGWVYVHPKATTLDWADRWENELDFDLIVNATGSKENIFGDLSDSQAIIYDLSYGETALLTEGKAFGLRTIDGLPMLVHQAALSFKIWFGIDPFDTDVPLPSEFQKR